MMLRQLRGYIKLMSVVACRGQSQNRLIQIHIFAPGHRPRDETNAGIAGVEPAFAALVVERDVLERPEFVLAKGGETEVGGRRAEDRGRTSSLRFAGPRRG